MSETCSKTFNLCNLRSESKTHLIFLDPDGGPSVQRFDTVQYQNINKLNEKMEALFWRPEEINLSKDRADFMSLDENQQEIFTETLLRAVLLDSVQGRAPFAMFEPIVSLPEAEAFFLIQTFFELIHSQSYSYIIRNVYPKPDEVFDRIKDIQPIIDCAKDISGYYDALHRMNVLRDAKEMGYDVPYNEYEHKIAIWDCLVSINALEAIRFYSAFACFFNYAENGYMLGNAKILQLIARDENLHVAGTSQLLTMLPKSDPDFEKIKTERKAETAKIYNDVVFQELEWVKYIFRNGSLLGLNEQILGDYIKFMARKRLRSFNVTDSEMAFDVVNKNPLEWMSNYLNTENHQPAPQESEIISYQTGAVKHDLENFSFDL